MLIAALAFVAIMFAADLRIEQDGSSDTTVPYVLGDNLDVARAKIEALGVSVRVIGEAEGAFGEIGLGAPFVARQIPRVPLGEQETEVPQDATVTLFVDYR